MEFSEFLSPDICGDPVFRQMFPNLAAEKAEDLQDTQPLYSTRFSDIQKE